MSRVGDTGQVHKMHCNRPMVYGYICRNTYMTDITSSKPIAHKLNHIMQQKHAGTISEIFRLPVYYAKRGRSQLQSTRNETTFHQLDSDLGQKSIVGVQVTFLFPAVYCHKLFSVSPPGNIGHLVVVITSQLSCLLCYSGGILLSGTLLQQHC